MIRQTSIQGLASLLLEVVWESQAVQMELRISFAWTSTRYFSRGARRKTRAGVPDCTTHGIFHGDTSADTSVNHGKSCGSLL